MAIISKLIEGLTNDVEHFVRVYPINAKGFAQSELDGQVASVIPKASRLPKGYTELTYIESSGTQYIDTELKPTQNTRIVGRVKVIQSSFGKNAWVFGARNANATARFDFPYLYESKAFRMYYGSDYYTFSGIPVGELTFDFSAKGMTLNGTTYESAVESFATSNSILICSCKGGTAANETIAQDVYQFQIYDGDTLVRDFVPCLSDADGIGLFDLVEGKFYGNAGSGVFTAGSGVA